MILALLAALAFNAPSTLNNDDSCDITAAPAATLLLPVFDVNVSGGSLDETTLFTVTNVTSSPQIARVTLWTDWSWPVLTFNLFLTGYDVQSVSLYDVIARGQVAPGGPGTSSTLNSISPNATLVGLVADPGSAPLFNSNNPNIANEQVLPGGPCSGTNLPSTLSKELAAAVRDALTTGFYSVPGAPGSCGGVRVGGSHRNARGYATIDVVARCASTLPNDPDYYTADILFDNALIGDYQQVNHDPTVGNMARANPMVHIRAVPEGGAAGSPAATNLPYTFYDRFTPATNRKVDRRMPLPSAFAARWIEAGTSSFNTVYKIWREGVTAGAQTRACSAAALNSAVALRTVVRFDERENSFTYTGPVVCTCGFPLPTLPASSVVTTSNTAVFPSHTASPDISGWMYLDLNSRDFTGLRPSQNWVVISLFAQGRYSADFDAAQLGNGCSPAAVLSEKIGPPGGVFQCPPGVICPPR